MAPEEVGADTDGPSAPSLARSTPSAGASMQVPLYIPQQLLRRAVGKSSPHQEAHQALLHQEPHSTDLSLSICVRAVC